MLILLINMELLEKKCYDCKTVKSASEFHKHKNEIGGLKNQCKACCAIRRSKYYKANKIIEQKASKKYKKENSRSLSEATREYRKRNPDKVKKWKKTFYLKCMSDPVLHLHLTFGSKLNRMIKKSKNNKTIKELLGYSFEELVKHLEQQFSEGMTWENYGKAWHIDHIVPKSWFKFSGADDPEFQKCWALSNLQPLWAEENLKKGNRYQSIPSSSK